MMTLERVEVLTYRGGHRRRSDDVVADRLRMLAAAAEAARLEDPSEGAIVTRVGASIRAAHDYGASVAEIAETTGLPESEVERVLGETG